MSIRAKLILIFVLVVGFSGANLFVFYWSKNQNDASLEELRKATEVQGELSQIQRELNDMYKQNAIMGQFITATEDAALQPEEIERFDTQTESVSARIKEISGQEGDNSTEALGQFVGKYNDLVKSWRRFYLYFGRDHTKALTELAINADPLGAEVIQIYLPALLDKEQIRRQQARENYYRISETTGVISTSMFTGSTLLLMIVLLWFSHDLINRLIRLRFGAEKIGAGDLDYRIEDDSRDELGDLAGSFNQMSSSLLKAREELDEQYKIVDEQRQRSQHLLLNILPEETAEELRENGVVAPQYYSAATVMFADIKGFTAATENLSVDRLVEILHEYFTAFDKICEKYNIEKLKTIGDCYMAVSGVPTRNLSHCADMILAAWECINIANEISAKDGYPDWQIRVGIHSGPVVAGVVGIKKFAFDIWGSTVNQAARLESCGEASRINISEDSRAYVKDLFKLYARGSIKTKEGKGVKMYFVEGVHESLNDGPIAAAQGFAERYQVYFRETIQQLPKTLS